MSVVLDSLKWELQRHPLFEALTEEDLAHFLSSARQVVFPARKRIFEQGDESESLFIVLSGRVKISVHSGAGKETVLSFMGANDVLGEMGVLDGGARSAGATALEGTRALQIYRRDIIAFLERNPTIAMRIIATLATRLRHTNAQLEDIATLPTAPRLARALLRLAEQHGKKEESGAVRIEFKISQAVLGAHAGVMRENVNRQIKQWESDGLVASDAGVLTLLDPAKMKAISEG